MIVFAEGEGTSGRRCWSGSAEVGKAMPSPEKQEHVFGKNTMSGTRRAKLEALRKRENDRAKEGRKQQLEAKKRPGPRRGSKSQPLAAQRWLLQQHLPHEGPAGLLDEPAPGDRWGHRPWDRNPRLQILNF